MRGVKKLTLALAAAMLAGGPVSAACWSSDVVDAAYVRDLDTLLMMATLRCRAQGVEISADYNRFVREKRSILSAANDQLRAQFAVGRSGQAALDAYDSFATAQAKSHGAGSQSHDCADFKALAQAAAEAAPDRGALLQLALRAGANPAIPNESCTHQLALAR